MRGGVILIVVALLVGYLGVTGKYQCFTAALDCLVGGSSCECKGGLPGALGGASSGAVDAPFISFPRVEPIRPIPPLTPGIAGPISI